MPFTRLLRTGNYLCRFDTQRGNFILSPAAGRNALSASSQNASPPLSDSSPWKIRNTCPRATRCGREQMTPLELADFTSGMPDDPTNLPRGLQRRSIESYTVKDFLTWASNYEARTQLPAPYQSFQRRNRAAKLPGRDRDRQNLGRTGKFRDSPAVLGMADTTPAAHA